jgi:hypothetical protein
VGLQTWRKEEEEKAEGGRTLIFDPAFNIVIKIFVAAPLTNRGSRRHHTRLQMCEKREGGKEG